VGQDELAGGEPVLETVLAGGCARLFTHGSTRALRVLPVC
jgi:hypothetical protein